MICYHIYISISSLELQGAMVPSFSPFSFSPALAPSQNHSYFRYESVGGSKVILWSQICGVFCPQNQGSNVGTPQPWLSKIKTGVWQCQIVGSQVFFHAYFGWWGHFFCTKWLNTKTEIDRVSKPKKTPWFGTKNRCLTVGMCGTIHGATHQTTQLSMSIGQIGWQIVDLIWI